MEKGEQPRALQLHGIKIPLTPGKDIRGYGLSLIHILLSVSVLPSASALFSKKLYYYGVVEGVSRTVEGKVESILVLSLIHISGQKRKAEKDTG